MQVKHLKKFTSMTDVTSEHVRDVLELWQNGDVDTTQVMLFAEHLYDIGPGFPSYPVTDSQFVVVNVLDALVMMYSNPTTESDIPALKKCLSMAASSPEEAMQFLHSYWSTINWDKRLQDQSSCIECEDEQ